MTPKQRCWCAGTTCCSHSFYKSPTKKQQTFPPHITNIYLLIYCALALLWEDDRAKTALFLTLPRMGESSEDTRTEMPGSLVTSPDLISLTPPPPLPCSQAAGEISKIAAARALCLIRSLALWDELKKNATPKMELLLALYTSCNCQGKFILEPIWALLLQVKYFHLRSRMNYTVGLPIASWNIKEEYL